MNDLAAVADKQRVECKINRHQSLINQSLEYLSSAEAIESIEIDAYWPKWDGPWWQMMLLHEMGLTDQIPEQAVEKIIDALDSRLLKFFPFTEEEIPPGVDPIRGVGCHCQLGTMYQLLTKYGIDVDERLPWIRPWFLRYQLNDGGLNCDEAAYTKNSPKSSIVSTVPALEAILTSTQRDFTSQEINFLDKGANYLIEKRLFRSSTTNCIIDEEWLNLCFPRFYMYDSLRGLSFLSTWALTLNRQLPMLSVQECVLQIDKKFPDGRILVERACWEGANSRRFDKQTGEWSKGPAAGFPLLEAVGIVGIESPQLTSIWGDTKANLKALIQAGQLI